MSEKFEIQQILDQPDQCLKLALSICQKHSLPSDCVRIGNQTQHVFAVAQRFIIKFFPPSDPNAFQIERTFLQSLYQQLPIRTPELYAADSLDGADYIVMEHLPGTAIEHVWGTLSIAEQGDIMGQLGRAIHALHALPVGDFQTAPSDWHSFIDQQKQDLITNHRNFGLDDAWVSQLSEYVDSRTLDLHDRAQIVPLHTELMQEHIFLSRDAKGWQVAGMIDFEPAMLGHREYEFCAVGLFLTQGKRELLREFLVSYGYAEADLTAEFSRRIMILMLLHRYSDLSWFLALIPSDRHVTTLAQLEQFWYGV